MLQMTTIELSELIQQQMLENPVLEEVASQEETRELQKEILDQLSSGSTDFEATTFDATAPDVNGAPPQNGAGEVTGEALLGAGDIGDTGEGLPGAETSAFEGGEEETERGEETRDAFEEIDSAASSEYPPGTKRRIRIKRMSRPSNNPTRRHPTKTKKPNILVAVRIIPCR